jgi:hypothetical protein
MLAYVRIRMFLHKSTILAFQGRTPPHIHKHIYPDGSPATATVDSEKFQRRRGEFNLRSQEVGQNLSDLSFRIDTALIVHVERNRGAQAS